MHCELVSACSLDYSPRDSASNSQKFEEVKGSLGKGNLLFPASQVTGPAHPMITGIHQITEPS